MEKKINPGLRSGTIAIPASKSDAQRAYIAAALAKGKSTITGWGNSSDETAILMAIRKLGASIETSPDNELIISGIEQFPSEATISAGESGLGIRLLTTICAAHKGVFKIEGEGSLAYRPMDFFENALPLFGAQCSTSEGKVPLKVTGPLKGMTASVDGSLSSQFVSGLLMALPLAGEDSEIHVADLKSKPYVSMTIQTLQAFGIDVDEQDMTDFRISGGQYYHATQYKIDADWSSASYWLVAAAIGHDISLSGLRLDSLQADKALMSFLQAANCQVVFNRESIIGVEGKKRRAFSVDATDCPDLFPALVTLAAYCNGTSVIKGAKRLTHKESHRAITLQSEFGKLGVKIDLDEDTMLIHGTGVVKGGIVSSHNDHRIAMCLGIAGLSAESPVTIEHAEAVAKSYPSFWNVIEAI